MFRFPDPRPILIILMLLMALLTGATVVNAQHFNSEVEAEIITNDAKDDILEITGTANNLTEANFSLRYELSVITSNGTSNNTSRNSQSGRFTLEPFETKTLSQTAVSIDPNKRTIVLLVLYDLDDKVIGTDRMVYDQAEQQNAEANLSYKKDNEGIQLLGMVTEKTKTKAGKDFYDFFYQKYSLSPKKGNKIVEVEEIISHGRTTRIAINVERQTVFQFFAKPKLDYLKEMADEALRRVNRYFEYLENRNEFTQY